MKYKLKKTDRFALSLKRATSVDSLRIKPARVNGKIDLAFWAMLFACVLVLAGVLIYFASLSLSYSHADDIYSDLQSSLDSIERLPYMALPADSPSLADYDSLISGGESLVGGASTESLEFIRMKTRLDTLCRTNPDIMGWITVEDTCIDYPTVKGQDNDFYLDHAYDREYLNSGSIFLDFRCKDSLENTYNTVIYGHNMFSGLMFHDVIKYKGEDFFLTHDIVITTSDGIHTFRPISVYETVSTDYYYQVDFDSDAEFCEFLERACERSIFQTEYTPDGSDRIITFSTCTNDGEYGRLVLHAVLIEKRT